MNLFLELKISRNKFIYVAFILCMVFFNKSQGQIQQQRYLYSQPKISQVSVKNAVWITGKDTISLEKGEKPGIALPDSLVLLVTLNTNAMLKNKQKELTCDFRWFRFGPMGKVPSKIFKEKVAVSDKDKNIKMSTTYKALRKGWWEVEIFSYTDKGYIRHENHKKLFRILIK